MLERYEHWILYHQRIQRYRRCLGLRLAEQGGDDSKMTAFHSAIDLLLGIRLQAKQNKDWATSDKIRNELTALGFQIKDTKDGFEWSI